MKPGNDTQSLRISEQKHALDTGDTRSLENIESLVRQRRTLLRTISSLLDKPMTVLSLVWVILMVLEFAGYGNSTLQTLGLFIWALFLFQFAIEFWIAPRKWIYLRKNWLTAIALVLPAFRLLRAFRALRLLRLARVGRGVGLLRWITSLNRGMKVTKRTVRRQGLSYVLLLTLLVDLTGAAAIYQFENPHSLAAEHLMVSPGASTIDNYGEAVWWTSMMMTTMGSDYFPKSTEGRFVALLLAVYAFAIFGYITATVAGAIIHTDPTSSATAHTDKELNQDIADLRAALQTLHNDVNKLVEILSLENKK